MWILENDENNAGEALFLKLGVSFVSGLLLKMFNFCLDLSELLSDFNHGYRSCAAFPTTAGHDSWIILWSGLSHISILLHLIIREVMLLLECLQDGLELRKLSVSCRHFVELADSVSWVDIDNFFTETIKIFVKEVNKAILNVIRSSSILKRDVLSHNAEIRWSKGGLIHLIDLLPDLGLEIGKVKG